jgi:hypothetical protein
MAIPVDWRRLALLVVVVLAGCGSVPPREPPAAPSPTPAPVPTDDPSAAYPPGLSLDRIDRPVALAAAHDQALAGESFTMVTRTRVDFENGTRLLDVTRRRSVGANRDRWLVTRSYERTHPSLGIGDRIRTESWYNRSYTFQRVRTPNGTSYSGPVPTPPTGLLTDSHRLSLVYSSATASNTTIENRTLVLRTMTPPATDRLTDIDLDRASSWQFTATLGKEGGVKAYRVSFTVTLPYRDDVTVTVTGVTTVRFIEVGETSVVRPDWVAEARATVTTETAANDTKASASYRPVCDRLPYRYRCTSSSA